MLQRLMSPISLAVDFPLAPAEDEAKLLKLAEDRDKSMLVLGRSGTGKTTLVVHHMFQTYVQALKSGTCCSQLFVTNNAVLVSSVKKAFRGMQEGVAGVTAADTPSWEDLEDRHWPLFLTKQDFLLFVNEHVETSFFEDKQWDAARDATAVESLDGYKELQELLHMRKMLVAQQKDGAKNQQRQIGQALKKVERDLNKLGKSHETEDQHRSTSRLDRGQMVDYRFFLLQMWPKISSRGRVSPSAVWTEIMSFIRGGPTGELTEQEYLALPKKDSPLFREFAEEGDARSRKAVYKVYLDYKSLLKELQAWDCSELVTHLCRQVKQHGWRGPGIKSVLVDEVQE